MVRDSFWAHLELKAESIRGKWLQLLVDTYPVDSVKFLKQEKDCFVNPIGYTLSQEITNLYDELIHRMDMDKIRAALDRIIQIRAIQEFLPSQAVGFISGLKRIVREELAADFKDNNNPKEMLELESRIDEVILLCFDVYMARREKVYNIRLKELAKERDYALDLLDKVQQ